MSKAYGYGAYGGPETETWFDRPVPTPGPSELLIEVKAAGVNPVDHKVRGGAMANPEATPDFPLVPGGEAAGVVVAVGSDADGFVEGDAVRGRSAPEHGSYAEHAVLLAEDTTHKAPRLGSVDAILDVVGGDPMREVAALANDPAQVVSIADPGVVELGGSFLRSGSAGVPALAGLVAEGKVDPKVLQTYPFDEAAQALRAVESGHVLGKIVIDLEQTTQS